MQFSIKVLEHVKFFLEIEVNRSKNSEIILCQRKYISKLLNKTKMKTAKPMPTPMISNQNLSKNGREAIKNIKQYRSVIGALQYTTMTRPDIVFSVNKLSPCMQDPRSEHWKAVKRVLRYLKGTINYGISFKACNNLNITCYTDADWATDPDDKKSVTGYCIFIEEKLISWCSKKQSTISRSSTEAEYMSVASATTEIMWLQSILRELKLNSNIKATLWCDNQSAVYMTVNPILHFRTKHIEIDVHFV